MNVTYKVLETVVNIHLSLRMSFYPVEFYKF